MVTEHYCVFCTCVLLLCISCEQAEQKHGLLKQEYDEKKAKLQEVRTTYNNQSENYPASIYIWSKKVFRVFNWMIDFDWFVFII